MTAEDIAYILDTAKKGSIRYYRESASVTESAIQIVAINRAKGQIKARLIGSYDTFTIDLNYLAAHGGSVEE